MQFFYCYLVVLPFFVPGQSLTLPALQYISCSRDEFFVGRVFYGGGGLLDLEGGFRGGICRPFGLDWSGFLLFFLLLNGMEVALVL
jgi:hypothetical protein